MGNIEKVFLVLLVLDALALIGLVLLQQGKGADVGAAFGSGSSGTVFGSSGGANFLTRLTTSSQCCFLSSPLVWPIWLRSERSPPRLFL